MSKIPNKPCAEKMAQEKPPIINCHAHIFTGDYVPPYLAKSVLRWPLFHALNFRVIFYLCRKRFSKKDKMRFDGSDNLERRTKFEKSRRFHSRKLLFALYTIVGTYATIQGAHILLQWAFSMPEKPGAFLRFLKDAQEFLQRIYILLPLTSNWVKVGLLLLIVLFYRSGRNFLLFVAKQLFSILRKIPGKQTKELLERYMTIGRYAFHTEQGSTLSDLKEQYPDETGFVILPMDMEFMDAGTPAKSYEQQMEELAILKANHPNIYPFVFIDPRRVAKEKEKFFDYIVSDGRVVLKDCFIKKYIEGHTVQRENGTEANVPKFSGFKIYPALGYYPFDPLLLPLWKYAEQNSLPILTHCVRGPMYFRGTKERSWDYHPIFEELKGPLNNSNGTVSTTTTEDDHYTSLLLPEMDNDVFSANFTHPMNFAVLLKKEFLAKAVQLGYEQGDAETKQHLIALFGFTPKEGLAPATVTSGLDDLKICFGHYGGGDEWLRYFDTDRFNHSAQVVGRPDFGIDFLYLIRNGASTNKPSRGKPEQLWKYTDWYSIISSLLLQHANVYADISYILHADAEILPLLKQTLQNPCLREKILYGTDFFVVRNHKTDKNMLADMMGGLEEDDFDQIARYNPRAFLNLLPMQPPVEM